MKKALIGFSGFIGSNLLRQTEFGYLYNRNNIIDSQKEEFDLVFCAAPSAVKWRANKEPEKDLEEVNNLISSIKNINTNCFILISTVDVYTNPSNVYEDTQMELNGMLPYGKNRYLIENFVRHNFENHLIVRLPSLFGNGLKKNFIFDLIHNNCLDWTDRDSEFQFYGLAHLWADINIAIRNSIEIINITSEPISAHEIALRCFNLEFNNKNSRPPDKYNMKSRYDYLFGGEKGYMYGKDTIIREICEFIESNGA